MNQIIVAALIFFSSSSFACSFVQMTEDFDIDAEFAPTPMTPNFVVEKIVRGSDDGNIGSCSDAGILTLKRKNSPENPTGYIFEILTGEFEDQLFYPEPVRATERFEQEGLYKFVWLDGSNDEQEPINIEVKIVALSKSGERSKPQILKVTHPGIKKPWWKIW